MYFPTRDQGNLSTDIIINNTIEVMEKVRSTYIRGGDGSEHAYFVFITLLPAEFILLHHDNIIYRSFKIYYVYLSLNDLEK